MFFAKQVVSNLHRKKIGHKRMLVSYTRDSSLTEINTLRCQVAGLLKNMPFWIDPIWAHNPTEDAASQNALVSQTPHQ
ncbi:uncharacterized protein LOC128865148 isoform X3 [Anastrepha ludens]|uniref:uncharacterized protein LOC128865148 isoform X3 n=1 Tax=Anastrepha ludens TaxID=28586 RepID=UPI0023B0277C|nr:uncharacterized protein LOC128865148 isoform X3 [Anastrepha ludens]